MKEVEDGQDEWHDLSSDGIVKGGELFGVYRLDDCFDDGLF